MAKPHGHRCSVRLPSFDYSAEGWYFVTLITRFRHPYFSDPLLLRRAEENYLRLPEQYSSLTTDAWAVMPDHMHFLIQLDPPAQERRDGSPTEAGDRGGRRTTIGRSVSVDPLRPTLGQVVRSFKARVTRRAHQSGEDDFQWQGNYSERVIRSEEELQAARKYILHNPVIHRSRSTLEADQVPGHGF